MFKIKTVFAKELIRNNWVDVETINQSDVNNFFNSQKFNKQIKINREKKSNINKIFNYNMIVELFSKNYYEKLNYLAFRNFKKVFGHLIEFSRIQKNCI